MEIEWFGQSAFRLADKKNQLVIDPFAEMGYLSSRGMRFDYPPIAGVRADLVLVTHEHADHNGVAAIEGSPAVVRSTAGHLDSPLGEIVAIASEHDQSAGIERGPNTIFVFSFGGLRVSHFGDFGQAQLRTEQQQAIGELDLLFLPVGGGPTIGAASAAEIVKRLDPSWVVPMHYRTPAIDFLEPADEFAAAFPENRLIRFDDSVLETEQLDSDNEGPRVLIPAAPAK